MAERRYFRDLTNTNLEVGETMSAFGRHNIRGGQTPGLMMQDSWRNQTDRYLMDFEVYIRVINELEPPEGMKIQGIHRRAVLATETLEKAIDAYTRGLNNIDADALSDATIYLADFTGETIGYAAVIERYCD